MEKRISFFAYDTICEIHITIPDNHNTNPALLESAKAIALEVEATLSMFDEKSELSTLCKNYLPHVPYKVSEMLFYFLEQNLKIAELSKGAFDPTVGSLVKMWDFLAESPAVPEASLLKANLAKVGYRHIKLNSEGHSIIFDIPGIVLDPGASGKGFSLGLVVDYLLANGVKEGIVNFGGNLFVMGKKNVPEKEESRLWKVAIQDPDKPELVIGTVDIQDRGIATSSWYEHCFEKEGQIFHHLLDPMTGSPKPLSIKSVSIISSNAIFTDLLSTAFFILGEEMGRELITHLREDTNTDIDYVAVLEDGSISISKESGFQAIK